MASNDPLAMSDRQSEARPDPANSVFQFWIDQLVVEAPRAAAETTLTHQLAGEPGIAT